MESGLAGQRLIMDDLKSDVTAQRNYFNLLFKVKTTLETSGEEKTYTRNEWRKGNLHSKRLCYQQVFTNLGMLITDASTALQTDEAKEGFFIEAYSRIGLLRSHGNLQSYWTTTKPWKLTVVLHYYEAMETYSRIALLRSYVNLQSYWTTTKPWKLTVVLDH